MIITPWVVFALLILGVSLASSTQSDNPSSATSLPSTSTPRPTTQAEFDQFVQEINNVRRSFAKKHNIADMHELTWNEELLLETKKNKICMMN
ncbi:hypothetical protein GCK72_007575 [Caenorhabditis remanei]|uniref:SCP domain-containing protein n=1 Tax=Caenorhabditis remanei TaxID=31234 RepID=A0A6A5HLR4_CAERE|nr:hypothetical protein GCK72_007575 [Caenorhabditis remanei]KAF1767616.1 hypothetical protein GCK72_007575 [Caenorhabditis remanei]